MQTLGYIVTKRKLKDIPSFIEVINDAKHAKEGKPILYIGLERAKKSIQDFSPIEFKYPNEVYWTYDKTEKRVFFEDGMQNFIEYCLKKSIDGLRYYYINILTLPLKKAKKLIQIIKSDTPKYIYISGSMIYIYYKSTSDEYVMGISLSIIEFCGIDKNKVIKYLYKYKSNIISYDDSFLDRKSRLTINNKKYAIAYFMST